jgi:hypothetical protein
LLQWTIHPFVFQNKKIYTVLIWCRVLAYLVVSVFLVLLFIRSPSIARNEVWTWICWKQVFVILYAWRARNKKKNIERIIGKKAIIHWCSHHSNNPAVWSQNWLCKIFISNGFLRIYNLPCLAKLNPDTSTSV